MKNHVSFLVLALLLTSMLIAVPRVQPISAIGTIHIRADGSIDPPTAPISTVDNITYIFTGNTEDSIVIEKDNIVLDGKSYSVQGTNAYDSKGIDLTERSNVTIKNMNLKAFHYGFWLHSSTSTNVSGNNMTNNSYGVRLESSSNNSINGNTIADNWSGIGLSLSSDNRVSRNNITTNYGYGIRIMTSSNNNSISENNIASTYTGIELESSSYDRLTRNNVTDNWGGIIFTHCSNTTLRDNRINGNEWNFGVYGWELSDFINDVDSTNSVDGKPIYYWVNKNGGSIPSDAGYVAVINSTGVTVKGLELSKGYQSILLVYSTNTIVENNNVHNNSGHGVQLHYSMNNTIYGNKITANKNNGIHLESSINNSLIGNTITDNLCGIGLSLSFNNSIIGNSMANNSDSGIGLSYHSFNNNIRKNTFFDDGLVVDQSFGNAVIDNQVNAKPLVYLEDISDHTVEDAGQVILINCTRIAVENLNLSHTAIGVELWQTNDTLISGNSMEANNLFGIRLESSSNNSLVGNTITASNYLGISLGRSSRNSVRDNSIITASQSGIQLYYSSSNNVTGNRVLDNQCGVNMWGSWANNVVENDIKDNSNGIWLGDSSNNTIRGNNISSNSEDGIYFYSSSGNRVCHNNFVDNDIQADGEDSTSIWDNGCEGNYWSDCNHTDTNGDGICDTQYVLDANNTDRYPLMNMYWSACDVNHDLKVDMRDIGVSAKAFGTVPGEPLWNPHADITGPEPLVADGKVDMRDIGFVARHFGEHYV